jgi:hypothetical protein
MPRIIPEETLPRETVPLTPAVQPFAQQLAYPFLKLVQGTAVVGDPKRVEMPSHLPCDGLPAVGEFAGVAFLA